MTEAMARVKATALVLLLSLGAATAHAEPPAVESVPSVGQHEPPTVQGRVDRAGVLHLWGTPHEMGYAHGRLMAKRIISVVDGYALRALPARKYALVREALLRVLVVPPALRAELEGLAAGLRDSSHDESARLKRSLDVEDLIVLNAWTEVVRVGCSSLSAWGESTAADPSLKGALAIVRNLEWSDAPALLEQQLVIRFAPKGGQPVVSIAFPGYVGCLSCMNASSVGAFFNMGRDQRKKTAAPKLQPGLTPATLALRAAMEAPRSADRAKLAAALSGRWMDRGIVHVVDPHGATVLELSDTLGTIRRGADPESKLGGSMLAATNHLRAGVPQQRCRRYEHIERAGAGPTTEDAMWALSQRVALASIVYRLLYVPAQQRLRLQLRAPRRMLAGSPPGRDVDLSELLAPLHTRKARLEKKRGADVTGAGTRALTQ